MNAFNSVGRESNQSIYRLWPLKKEYCCSVKYKFVSRCYYYYKTKYGIHFTLHIFTCCRQRCWYPLIYCIHIIDRKLSTGSRVSTGTRTIIIYRMGATIHDVVIMCYYVFWTVWLFLRLVCIGIPTIYMSYILLYYRRLHFYLFLSVGSELEQF